MENRLERHLSVTEGFVLVANYAGGTVASLPILADGSLGPAVSVHAHPAAGAGKHARQDSAHPHAITLGKARRFLLESRLGAFGNQLGCASDRKRRRSG